MPWTRTRLGGTGLEITHVNLLDNTVEGVRLPLRPRLSRPVPPRKRARARRTAAICLISLSDMMKEAQSACLSERTSTRYGHRLRPHRHRTGRRVRLCRHAGLPGAQGGGLRGDLLVNSNPATIMTDTSIADKVYMEPLKLQNTLPESSAMSVPDAIVPGIGGQTGLNLAMQLESRACCAECRWKCWELPAHPSTALKTGSSSKQLCQSLGEPVLPSIDRTFHRGGPGRRRRKSAIRSSCAPLSRWAAPGGGFADDEAELPRNPEKRPHAFPGASGAGGKEHQGIQGD